MALPHPVPDDVTQPFWDGVAAGELRIQHCEPCDVLIHLPEFACPHCGSEAVAHRTLSGSCTLHAWTRIVDPPDPTFADLVPYTIGVVELVEQEGLLLSAPFTQTSDPASDDAGAAVPLTVGEPLQITFGPLTDGETVVPQLHREGAHSGTHA